jgi:hypothetical protein
MSKDFLIKSNIKECCNKINDLQKTIKNITNNNKINNKELNDIFISNIENSTKKLKNQILKSNKQIQVINNHLNNKKWLNNFNKIEKLFYINQEKEDKIKETLLKYKGLVKYILESRNKIIKLFGNRDLLIDFGYDPEMRNYSYLNINITCNDLECEEQIRLMDDFEDKWLLDNYKHYGDCSIIFDCIELSKRVEEKYF